jgi:K319L-like, PKD domain
MKTNNCIVYFLVSFIIFLFPTLSVADEYYGCVHKKRGKLRIVDAPGQCHKREYEISWEGGQDTQQKLNELLGRIQALENALGVINEAPTVNAGPDQSILLSMNANLEGIATDDGLIKPLVVFWEKISGPGDAYINDQNNLLTFVDFEQAGDYVLKLTADDGSVVVSDDVTVVVFPDNDPPVITSDGFQEVGAKRELSGSIGSPSRLYSDNINLAVSVTDDDLPMPLTFEWSILNVSMKPAAYTQYNDLSVFFSNEPPDSKDWPLNIRAQTRYPHHSNQLATEVEVELMLSVSDGYHKVQAPLTVNCNVAANDPPSVEAGDDQNVVGTEYSTSQYYGYSGQVNLNGSVIDDGLPSDLITRWYVNDINPTPNTYYRTELFFSSQSEASTFINYRFVLVYPYNTPAYYHYLPDSVSLGLGLEATDGYHTISDTVTITVNSPF